MNVAEFRKLALAFEGAAEHPHFEKTAFQCGGKIFATLDEMDASVVLKFSPIEQEAFSAIDSKNVSPVSGYWGAKGWTTIRLANIDQHLLRDMLKTAYTTVMPPAKSKRKTCPNGHSFEKSSDCPVCPKCEKAKQANPEFPKIGKPAHRALVNAGILRLKDLGQWSEADLLRLHGMGPKAIPLLKAAMKKAGIQFKTTETISVSAYLAAVPQPMRKILAAMRATIRSAAPKAEEKISYGIPTYKLNGPLIHWAAFKNHASLIGVDKGLLKAFATELKPFKAAGSTIRFTAAKPLPAALVKKIVKYRVAQNLQIQKARESLKFSKNKLGVKQ